MIRNIIVMSISFLLFWATAYGEPSRPIAKSMNTPVTVFDMFLLAIELEEKCPKDRKWGMTSIAYDFDDNLIRMEYSVKPEKIEGFKEGNEELKKRLLMKELDVLAGYIGVTGSIPKGLGIGPIWGIPIRYGWATKDFDVVKFKEEFSKRTVIILETIMLTSALEFKQYIVTRNHRGKTDYEVKIEQWGKTGLNIEKRKKSPHLFKKGKH